MNLQESRGQTAGSVPPLKLCPTNGVIGITGIILYGKLAGRGGRETGLSDFFGGGLLEGGSPVSEPSGSSSADAQLAAAAAAVRFRQHRRGPSLI